MSANDRQPTTSTKTKLTLLSLPEEIRHIILTYIVCTEIIPPDQWCIELMSKVIIRFRGSDTSGREPRDKSSQILYRTASYIPLCASLPPLTAHSFLSSAAFYEAKRPLKSVIPRPSTSISPRTSRITAIPTLLVNRSLHASTISAISFVTHQTHFNTSLGDSFGPSIIARREPKILAKIDVILTYKGHWYPSWTYHPSRSNVIDELQVNVRTNGFCKYHPTFADCLDHVIKNEPAEYFHHSYSSDAFHQNVMLDFACMVAGWLQYGKLGRWVDTNEKHDRATGLTVKELTVNILGPYELPNNWRRTLEWKEIDRMVLRMYENIVYMMMPTVYFLDLRENDARTYALMERVGRIRFLLCGRFFREYDVRKDMVRHSNITLASEPIGRGFRRKAKSILGQRRIRALIDEKQLQKLESALEI